MAAILCLLALAPGCAAIPFSAGVTISGTPQCGMEVCVLTESPIKLGQARPKVRAYGFANGYALWGADLNSAWAQVRGIS